MAWLIRFVIIAIVSMACGATLDSAIAYGAAIYQQQRSSSIIGSWRFDRESQLLYSTRGDLLYEGVFVDREQYQWEQANGRYEVLNGVMDTSVEQADIQLAVEKILLKYIHMRDDDIARLCVFSFGWPMRSCAYAFAYTYSKQHPDVLVGFRIRKGSGIILPHYISLGAAIVNISFWSTVTFVCLCSVLLHMRRKARLISM